ncbi:ribonucleoside-diphosphate reductase large subunit-like [Magnolia sinica]|uniref:ribonucleoside-diphosphate reductase large subunit-like n=1 Tax=Magnolia sinica TaxID=86752 RepID=UPI00265A9156|nr:ribonucleoside-diphosphate reductase large subunit-like [Magnolia sinica]
MLMSWSLFCPNEILGLSDCWGEEFEELYTRYEREGKAKNVVQAQTLWFEILKSQIETGTPYMLFKDTCNSSQTVVPTIAPAIVGDRRISLGPGAGCAGLAA